MLKRSEQTHHQIDGNTIVLGVRSSNRRVDVGLDLAIHRPVALGIFLRAGAQLRRRPAPDEGQQRQPNLSVREPAG